VRFRCSAPPCIYDADDVITQMKRFEGFDGRHATEEGGRAMKREFSRRHVDPQMIEAEEEKRE